MEAAKLPRVKLQVLPLGETANPHPADESPGESLTLIEEVAAGRP